MPGRISALLAFFSGEVGTPHEKLIRDFNFLISSTQSGRNQALSHVNEIVV